MTVKCVSECVVQCIRCVVCTYVHVLVVDLMV